MKLSFKYSVSAAPGNLLEFLSPGNVGSLMEFNWSWKFSTDGTKTTASNRTEFSSSPVVCKVMMMIIYFMTNFYSPISTIVYGVL